MSVDSVGFSAWETLPANTMLRVTLTARDYFVATTFPKAAQSIVDHMYPVARLIPSTRLALVSTDKTAVVDGIIHEETRGADLLNKLESLGSLSAFVSRVERLSARQKAGSASDVGAEERAETAEDAAAAQKADAWYTHALEQFKTLGTIAKWAAVVAGVGVVAFAVHEINSARK